MIVCGRVFLSWLMMLTGNYWVKATTCYNRTTRCCLSRHCTVVNDAHARECTYMRVCRVSRRSFECFAQIPERYKETLNENIERERMRKQGSGIKGATRGREKAQ